MDEENPRDSNNADVYYHFADNGYVTPQPVNTDISERYGPGFAPDPEAGDEAVYPEDPLLNRHTPSGLQVLGLVAAVHGPSSPHEEPRSVKQALGGEHKEKWHEAMEKELKALSDRNTWKIVPASLAQDRPILSGKWVFRIKTNSDGTIERFKARWVVRGFDQEYGRDFTETFAPVTRHTSLRILLAIAASRRRPLRQIDVANAFLYAPVDAEIFVEQPHGFVDNPSLVCQLLKSLYGIKQAPRLWQQYLHARLKRIGFNQLPHDQGMYRLTHDNDYVLLIVYVDDLLYIGSTITIVTWFERELQTDLSLTVSPNVMQYLGLNILDEDNAIRLSASKYASTIAERFCITPTHVATPYSHLSLDPTEETNPLPSAGIQEYQQKLGCLLFAAVTCRPDLSYSASQLATYLKCPEQRHLKELSQVDVSGLVAASYSCRSLSHPTVLWHHRLGHLSLPCLRSMASKHPVSGLPRVFESLPRSHAPLCTPYVEGRLRATPHSSSLRPATAPFHTLHLDVWGPAPPLGPVRERYFLVVVDD
ncbi:unnamed protein product [Closterium sp. NIES-54]